MDVHHACYATGQWVCTGIEHVHRLDSRRSDKGFVARNGCRTAPSTHHNSMAAMRHTGKQFHNPYPWEDASEIRSTMET